MTNIVRKNAQLIAAVAFQCIALAVAAPMALVVFGPGHARSLLIGGACVVIPWTLVTLREATRGHREPGALFVDFIVGQFGKFALTCLLLMLTHRHLEPVHWPALITGLLVTVHMPMFALLIRDPLARSATAGTGEPTDPQR